MYSYFRSRFTANRQPYGRGRAPPTNVTVPAAKRSSNVRAANEMLPIQCCLPLLTNYVNNIYLRQLTHTIKGKTYSYDTVNDMNYYCNIYRNMFVFVFINKRTTIERSIDVTIRSNHYLLVKLNKTCNFVTFLCKSYCQSMNKKKAFNIYQLVLVTIEVRKVNWLQYRLVYIRFIYCHNHSLCISQYS